MISQVRALLRQEGYRLPTCDAASVPWRVRQLELSESMRDLLRPLTDAIYGLNDQIDVCDLAITKAVDSEPAARRLTTFPSVGPVTALAFVAAVDQVERFNNAHQLEAYFGLVPSEWSSGEKVRRGAITKRGNSTVRWLLVETATRIMNHQGGRATEKLRHWGERIAGRRGKHVARVALARRITGVLFAMWRDGTDYKPEKIGNPKPTEQVAA
jgi:transposase